MLSIGLILQVFKLNYSFIRYFRFGVKSLFLIVIIIFILAFYYGRGNRALDPIYEDGDKEGTGVDASMDTSDLHDLTVANPDS